MKIHHLNLGDFMVNCYVIETAPGRCVAVDVGGDSDYFLNYLKKENLRLTKILLTHGHFDHIGGCENVRLATGAEVYIHADDVQMLTSPECSLFTNMGSSAFVPVTDCTAIRGDCIINDGDLSFKVMHTPGHSPGSVCYICEDVIFAGDTLFRTSIGRTDLRGSDPLRMENSLRQFWFMNDDYKIYPGHGEPTQLSFEKKYNPFLKRVKGEI